ncbi:MAG: bifunctional oligoribonuclease/PAP phosphatase NrnA [Candidatus Moraniibacteriota bacterium]|nr:MAG: bifunctional oligoribonuclease/PAP phosphatase NrnA [Candidatus Moranbacteria bacterium]
MRYFGKEFKTLHFVIEQAGSILLVAHKRPDPDTVGANLALKYYLESLGKRVEIACYDPFPENLSSLFHTDFLHPDQINLASFEAIIAADSVDRGFHLFRNRLQERQVVALIDHHPDIDLVGDIVMIDPKYSSSSEIVYLFFVQTKVHITKDMATALLAGILFDTGNFQHSSVSPQVMDIASHLMKLGAPLTKVSNTIFANKNISAMKLWGKALEKARFIRESGLLVTAVTRSDISECEATPDDIYQVASILSTVPEAKFALVLSERDEETVRGSLRASEHHGVDVSLIAHKLGGGGHKLASGFEVKGKIMESAEGWHIT